MLVMNSATMIMIVLPTWGVLEMRPPRIVAWRPMIVVVMHYDMMAVPIENAEVKRRTNMKPHSPVKSDMATIAFRLVPVYWRVSWPTPVAIHDSSIVVGNINDFTSCRFNHDNFAFSLNYHMFHFM